jgi:hypothetical protein
LITIEDFKEEYFDEILEILRRSFSTIRFGYTDEEKELSEKILRKEFLSPRTKAKVLKCNGVIKAGANLDGKGSFHIHDNTPLGRQFCCELVKHIENEARTAGNKDIQIFTLSGRDYKMPFLKEGYEVANTEMEYALYQKAGKKILRLAYLEKRL